MFLRSIALATVAALALSLTACSADSSSETNDDNNVTASNARPGGSVETFTGVDGQKYFRLVAANGLTLLRSEGYSGSPDATIGSLLKAAKEEPARFHVYEANNGGFYVDVTGAGASTESIASSEVYSSKSKAEAAAKTMIGYLKGIATVAYQPAQTGKRFDLYKLPVDESPSFNGQPQQFKFVVRADNGEAVLFSEAYASKQAAQKGIEAVKDYGRLQANYDINEIARDGQTRGSFALKAHTHSAIGGGGAGNNEAVAYSEIYSSKSNAQRGADAAKAVLMSDLDVNDLAQ